jgi:tetratricopeptide (TPR) repeat protein
MHALGLALAMTPGARSRQMELFEQSRDLARTAGDRSLLVRCHNNIAAALLHQGGDLPRAIALYDEGIAVARRSGNRWWEALLVGNRAGTLTWLGRAHEAIAGLREASSLTAQTGADIDWNTDLAYALLLVGRREDAHRASELALRASGTDQSRGAAPALLEALTQWTVGRKGAVNHLAAAVRKASDEESLWLEDAAHHLVRMAARTGQLDAASLGIDTLRRWSEVAFGPLRALRVRWLESLVFGRPHQEAVATMRSVADELEQMDHLLLAADALADAALVARADPREAAELEARSSALYRRCQVEPVLGPEPTAAAPS